jgi:hypothetical protein
VIVIVCPIGDASIFTFFSPITHCVAVRMTTDVISVVTVSFILRAEIADEIEEHIDWDGVVQMGRAKVESELRR